MQSLEDGVRSTVNSDPRRAQRHWHARISTLSVWPSSGQETRHDYGTDEPDSTASIARKIEFCEAGSRSGFATRMLQSRERKDL